MSNTTYDAPVPSINTRCRNRSNESIRVKSIINHVNNFTPLGKKIKLAYYETFDKEICKLLDNGGTNTDHYDFSIKDLDGTISKCEEKGTCKLINFNKLKTPWEKSVQRFNGPGNKYAIGRKYANHWYNTVIKDNDIREQYNITSSIPTLEEWLDKDAFKCGNPTSEYGKQLKLNYQKKHPKTSMNGKKSSPIDYRVKVNSTFEFNEEDKKILIEETQNTLNSCMGDKDCWLVTSGDINGKFKFKWYKGIKSVQIKDVELKYSEGSDIYFHFKTDDETTDFKAILRFGKGTGFSNIRFDIR